MYDADDDTFEPDTRNAGPHPAHCPCPSCRPDLHEGLPAKVSRALDLAGIRHTVEITGPSVLVTVRGPLDVALAMATLRGYDVAGDGERGLRVAPRGTWTAWALEEAA